MGLARRIIPSVMGKHLCIYCRTNGWHNNLTDVIDTRYYCYGFSLRGPYRDEEKRDRTPRNRRTGGRTDASPFDPLRLGIAFAPGSLRFRHSFETMANTEIIMRSSSRLINRSVNSSAFFVRVHLLENFRNDTPARAS